MYLYLTCAYCCCTSVCPDWAVETGPKSGVVKEWLRVIGATKNDLDLMLEIFMK